MSGDSSGEREHIPQSSADPYEYEDHRGVKIADASWDCPNCGYEGNLMYRPGSRNTCATCFWVVGGSNNDYRLSWGVQYREAQRLLASMGEAWHGTPGDVGTRLRRFFDGPEEVRGTVRGLRKVSQQGSREADDG